MLKHQKKSLKKKIFTNLFIKRVFLPSEKKKVFLKTSPFKKKKVNVKQRFWKKIWPLTAVTKKIYTKKKIYNSLYIIKRKHWPQITINNTLNNTIMNCSFNNQNISLSCGGSLGLKGSSRANTVAARYLAETLATKLLEKKIKHIVVIFKTVTKSQKIIITSLKKKRIKIIRILYHDAIAHNGCRRSKKRHPRKKKNNNNMRILKKR